MRYLILAAAAVGGFAAASNVSPAQAQFSSYPYCLISKNTSGQYGDCSYSTREQCKATASGQQADCDRNYALDYYGQQPVTERRPVRRSHTYRVQ